MKHICDSRPILLSNEIYEDYSRIVTGYENCDHIETRTRYDCGCRNVTEGVRGSFTVVYVKEDFCPDHESITLC